MLCSPRTVARVGSMLLMLVANGCVSGQEEADAPLLVYTAASVARPIRAVLDSFARRTRTRYAQESAASLELVRKMTELHAEPDVIVLADPELIPRLLAPAHVGWHALFGRNRVVLAYTPRSRGADAIARDDWWTVLERPGVQVGRADPNTDPSGYRTLLVWQLAAMHYGMPDLPARMLAASPPRNVRPREADQVALLQAGELDYIWTYESLARLMHLEMRRLPDDVDLGTPADSLRYASVSVSVNGRRAGEMLTIRGAPILFGVAPRRGSSREALAEQFLAFLLSPTGREILRREQFDVLDPPIIIGPAPTRVQTAASTPTP